jgi:2-dehydropantoate 2-reductase
VTLQNGLGNVEALAARAGSDRAIGGMVIIGFELTEPGEVAVTVYGGEVLLGRPGAGPGTSEGAPPDPDVARLVDAFVAAGIPTRATDNIAGAIWGKVLYNCALNALGAVLEVPYGELARQESWAVIGDIVREAFAVARAEGVRLAWPDPEAYLEVLRSRQIPATAAHRSSMLQDLARGRRTEIDHLNGAVAHLGAARGVPTPVNAALAALVRFLESRLPDATGTARASDRAPG